MPVTLVVKTPNQKLPDQTFCCQAEWTVLELKAFLQQQYPTNPKPEEQRLIYSGKLLCDSEILHDFLRDLDSEHTHTVHLVYVPRKTQSVENMDAANMPKVNNVDGLAEDGLRRRNVVPAGNSLPLEVHHHWAPNASQLPVWGSVNNQVPATDPMTQQFLWWQQNYAQQAQYWAQYMQHMNNTSQTPLSSVPTSVASTIPTTPVAPVQAPVAAAAPAPAPEVNARPQDAQRRGPLVVGLAAAQDDDDDGGIRVARDWLDWIYVGSRLAILLAVMYYYSSLPRFILVTLIVAGIYLYQKTIRRRLVHLNHWNEVNNNVNDDPAAGVNGQGAEENEGAVDGANAANGEAEGADRPAGPDPTPTSPPPTTNPNALNVALNVLVGFFTSLVPDVPAPEALN